MARRSDAKQATETLQEIEGVFDRLSDWVGQNPVVVLGALTGVLLVAAGIGLADWSEKRSQAAAAAAVAEVQTAYLHAMGAAPGSFAITEPANPETAREVREEYVEKFLTAAQANEGTVAAVSAFVEAGTLQLEAGDAEGALATWERARDAAEAGTDLRGLVLTRLARAYEDAGRSADAGAAHAEAGRIEALPTRRLALADAARCYADAGDDERALALWAEAKSLDRPEIPAQLRFRLAELEAARAN